MWVLSRKFGVGYLAKSQSLRLSLIVTVLMLTFSCQGFSLNQSINDLVNEKISLQGQVINLSADLDAKDIIIKDKSIQVDKLQNKLGGNQVMDLVSNVTWFVIGLVAGRVL